MTLQTAQRLTDRGVDFTTPELSAFASRYIRGASDGMVRCLVKNTKEKGEWPGEKDATLPADEFM